MKSLWMILLALSAWPSLVLAQSADLVIPSGGFYLASGEPIFVGGRVTVYATIKNQGPRDLEATAVCKDGERLVGLKSISLKAQGNPEDIWYTWTPAEAGDRVLTLDVIVDGINDQDRADATAKLQVFVDADTDGDGVGDSKDPDDDGDGFPDKEDAFPLDKDHSSDPNAAPKATESENEHDVPSVSTSTPTALASLTAETANAAELVEEILDGHETNIPVPSTSTYAITDTEQQSTDEPFDLFTQPNFLWILAVVSAVMAALFFGLARRKKRASPPPDDEPPPEPPQTPLPPPLPHIPPHIRPPNVDSVG